MYRSLIKISTADMPHEVWLEHRRKSIGGSDAASILGLNYYSSPYSVWAEKLGLLPEKEDSEAMRLGRDLEDYVAKRFSEATGKRVKRENNILINPDYPYAHANIDRVVIGEDAGLECKTTSTLNLKRFKNGDFPETYYVQCVHYMMVTGAKRWYLAVLVLGREFMHFTIERDEDEIAALAQSEEAFWQLVETRTAPMADGTQATSAAISAVYPEAKEFESVDLTAYESMLDEYTALSAQIKELEALRDEAANKVKTFLAESSEGESRGYSVSFKNGIKRTFDVKKFAAAYSNIDLSQFYKETSYRTFKVAKKSN